MFHHIPQPGMGCASVMIEMTARDYISLVEKIYRENGGITGQRAPLRTKTAKTIRNRMISDILKGVSLPPVVVGILLSSDKYEIVDDIKSRDQFVELLKTLNNSSISIIDGMQRTTALIEALESPDARAVSDIRVEFWIASEVNSLIYRMLVLNTGQVPWDISRQLEAIYRPVLKSIDNSVTGTIRFISKDTGKRSNLGPYEYETEDVAELLLIFSARKREVNIRDQIAQDFVRLDLIESTLHVNLVGYFTDSLKLLSRLNSALSTLENTQDSDPRKKYSRGSDILDGFPAKAGYFSALGIFLFDKPGFDTDWNAVPIKFERIRFHLDRIVKSIHNASTQDEKEEIILLEDLREKITKHGLAATQVGRFEREYFEKGFLALFEDIERIRNLGVAWSAY